MGVNWCVVKTEGSKKVPEAPESTRARSEMGVWPGRRRWTVRERWQGVGKGRGLGRGLGRGKYAAQLGPYWLGRAFFEGSGLGKAGWDWSGRVGICCQGPGNWDWWTS